jgi:hypothetical protein
VSVTGVEATFQLGLLGKLSERPVPGGGLEVVRYLTIKHSGERARVPALHFRQSPAMWDDLTPDQPSGESGSGFCRRGAEEREISLRSLLLGVSAVEDSL